MATVELKYGRSTVTLEYDDAMSVIGSQDDDRPLSDAEIGLQFDSPTGSAPLENIISPGQTVLLVVPDATREVGCGQIVNLLVRRLISNGTNAFDIRIIFATGIHRRVTDAEKEAILTPFIAQRIKTLDHEPRDLTRIARLGMTEGGIPVELDSALFEHDHIILIGGISFHYFAGFTGGRKLICPGLASTKTISATHRLAFDCERLGRREGVGTALLDGNAVQESFVEAAAFAKPSFAINSVCNDEGEIVRLYCGDWIESHRAACQEYDQLHTVCLSEKRPLVIVSCGGFPHDINMIQAHKSLDAAAAACAEGGTIILLAECPDGLGRTDFLDWFSAQNSRDLAVRLCEKYQVNGQTAFSLLQKTGRFQVGIITSIPDEALEKMRFRRVTDLAAEMEKAASKSGYIITNGARTRFSFS